MIVSRPSLLGVYSCWKKPYSVRAESPFDRSTRIRLPFLNRYAVGITAISNRVTWPGSISLGELWLYHNAYSVDFDGSICRCEARNHPLVTTREFGLSCFL